MTNSYEEDRNTHTNGARYLNAVASYQFWNNTLATSAAQTAVAKTVTQFLNKKSELAKKVLFVGYDGARADLLVNVLQSHPEEDLQDYSSYVSGHAPSAVASGIRDLVLNDGKIYLAYAGGLLGEKNEQVTETAPGFTSIATGVWSEEHGVTNNECTKNFATKTFMYEAAATQKMRSMFAASWGGYFEKTFVDEISALKENSEVPMTYARCASDLETFYTVKDALRAEGANERDVIFCTFEATDVNGHYTGFSSTNYRYLNGFRDEDEYAHELINTIHARPTYAQEDWLIILATDHGGLGKNHGGQSIEERTTWIATNKELNNDLFEEKYDGFTVEK